MTARPRGPVSLRQRALALIAQREHSPEELRRKLRQHARRCSSAPAAAGRVSVGGGVAVSAWTEGATDPSIAVDGPDALPDRLQAEVLAAAEAEIEALITWLTARDLLNVERFVETRIHARQARHGSQRIRQELAQHGVALDADTARTLADSDLDRARAVWARRYGHPPADAAERLRQMRFLAARGFPAEVVRQLLRAVADGGTDPDDAA